MATAPTPVTGQAFKAGRRKPAGGGRKLAPAASAPASFSPLYAQVKRLITEDLRSGRWKPGEMIPSEAQLASQHGVSQGTVRRAIDELSIENLLVRRQGRGTFVASHLSPRSQFRFLRLRRDDQAPLLPISTILDCRRAKAPIDVARQLHLRVGDSVIFVRRLLSVDGKPAVLDELWLPASRFKGLTAERLVAYRGPLYGLFESDFGTPMIRALERVRAVQASAQAAKLLGVRAACPLLLVERLSFTYHDSPVEVRKGYCVTTDLHYLNELN